VRFVPTQIAGAFVVEAEPIEDDRGFFARVFDAELFAAQGMDHAVAQANLSHNRRRGTLRGMHYQLAPASEPKYVRCVRGAIYDVVIDLRPGSASHLAHVGVELSAENRRALYMPGLCAHGFQTLEDDTDVLYQVGARYTPGQERGLRYDDEAFAIAWPTEVTAISEKDRSWAPFPASELAG
jgi:dTDP-4-dehydrorhamnose 3,5-epimerase